MEILRTLGETVNSAVDFMVEKNKKFTRTARIKKFIKKEQNTMIRAYITLGKHYYGELRDVPNYDMQQVCGCIDKSKREIKRLQERLAEINNEENLSDFDDFLYQDSSLEDDLKVTHSQCDCGTDCDCGSDCDCKKDTQEEAPF